MRETKDHETIRHLANKAFKLERQRDELLVINARHMKRIEDLLAALSKAAFFEGDIVNKMDELRTALFVHADEMLNGEAE